MVEGTDWEEALNLNETRGGGEKITDEPHAKREGA